MFYMLCRSEKDGNLYLVSDKRQATQDQQLAAMNLVPSRWGGPGDVDAWSGGGLSGQWMTTHQRVLGFFNNLKRDPYTTAAGALSKFYDAVCKFGNNLRP